MLAARLTGSADAAAGRPEQDKAIAHAIRRITVTYFQKADCADREVPQGKTNASAA
jgi:hypothetical protein